MKVTIKKIQDLKEKSQKIVALTAYDYPMAKKIDQAGIDIALVGDSLGMVVLGYDSTNKVTLADMEHHTKAVARGCQRAFIVSDMPFMSYQARVSDAVKNAGKLIQAGADAVKLEGGSEILDKVEAIIKIGIPVMGHIGLTPQTVTRHSGYRVQGKTKEAASKLLYEATLLGNAGCFAIVLECIPSSLAKTITEKIKIPTIGIGAGKSCDGQILVTHDMLGLFDKFTPRHVKKYCDLSSMISQSIKKYKTDVKKLKFPQRKNSF